MYNPISSQGAAHPYYNSISSALPAVHKTETENGEREIYNALLEGGLDGKREGEDYLSLYIRLHPETVEKVIQEEPSLLTEELLHRYRELTRFYPRLDILLDLHPHLFQTGGKKAFQSIYGTETLRKEMGKEGSSHCKRTLTAVRSQASGIRAEKFDIAEEIKKELQQNVLSPQEKNEFIQVMLIGRSSAFQRSLLIQLFKYHPELFYKEIFQAFPQLENDYPGLKELLDNHPTLLERSPGFLEIAYGDMAIERTPRHIAEAKRSAIANMVAEGMATLTIATLDAYFRTVIAAYEYQYGAELAGRSDLGSQFFGYYFMSSAYHTSGGNVLYLFPNRYGESSSGAVIGFNDSLLAGLQKGAIDCSRGIGSAAQHVHHSLGSLGMGRGAAKVAEKVGDVFHHDIARNATKITHTIVSSIDGDKILEVGGVIVSGALTAGKVVGKVGAGLIGVIGEVASNF